MEAVSCKI